MIAGQWLDSALVVLNFEFFDGSLTWNDPINALNFSVLRFFFFFSFLLNLKLLNRNHLYEIVCGNGEFY